MTKFQEEEPKGISVRLDQSELQAQVQGAIDSVLAEARLQMIDAANMLYPEGARLGAEAFEAEIEREVQERIRKELNGAEQ